MSKSIRPKHLPQQMRRKKMSHQLASNAFRAQILSAERKTWIARCSCVQPNQNERVTLHIPTAPNVCIKWPCVLLWLYFASSSSTLLFFFHFFSYYSHSIRQKNTDASSQRIWVEIGDLIRGLGFYVVVVFISFRFVLSFGVDVFWICFSFTFFFCFLLPLLLRPLLLLSYIIIIHHHQRIIVMPIVSFLFVFVFCI